MNLNRLPLLLALGLVASCNMGQYSVAEPTPTLMAPEEDPNGWGSAVPRTDQQLYGWDGAPVGGPVQSAEPGRVQVTEGSLSHTLEGTQGSGGSRLVLLELYQQTVEEREELALQVEVQTAALEQAEQRYQELVQRLAELEASHASLSAEKGAVEEECQDLAARLTTAQIRRLQAEKAWLQSAIEYRDRYGDADTMRRRLAEDAEGSHQ